MVENYRRSMYQVFGAIQTLAHEERYPVSTRIVELTGKTGSQVTRLLHLYYDWGYVSKKPTRGRRQKKVGNCLWYYMLTKKGMNKYMDLRAEFENNI